MLRTVEQLFPEHQVMLDGDRRDAAFDYRFLPRSVKQVVPARPRVAISSTTRRFSVATSRREALIRTAAAPALRLSPFMPFSSHVTVHGSGDSVVSHLTRVLGTPVSISIGIGTERANRKPVLEVFDRAGRPVAFVKVGVDEISIEDVSAEAEALRLVGDLRLAGIEVPRLISAERWLGHLVVVMTPLRTGWSWRNRRQVVPTEQMETLTRSLGSVAMPLRRSPFHLQHAERIGALATGKLSDRLARAFAELDVRHGSATVETGAWHGDWTPWNMSYGRNLLRLWDFERFDRNGLVGLDRRHYVVNESGQRLGMSVGTVLAALDSVVDGGDRSRSQVVSGCYLLAIATRYLTRMGTPTGHLIGDRAELMVEVLEEWLRRSVAATG